MAKKIQLTKETEKKMSEVRGQWIDKWTAKNGTEKVQSWMDDPDKLAIINALAYLEATGQ